MTENDVNLVLTKLREIVDEVGEDFVYPTRPMLSPGHSNVDCYYVWEDKPDCIAGKVLHSLGVSLELLAENEGENCDTEPLRIASNLSAEAMSVLSVAQNAQDNRMSYGHVLSEAIKAARELEVDSDVG